MFPRGQIKDHDQISAKTADDFARCLHHWNNDAALVNSRRVCNLNRQQAVSGALPGNNQTAQQYTTMTKPAIRSPTMPFISQTVGGISGNAGRRGGRHWWIAPETVAIKADVEQQSHRQALQPSAFSLHHFPFHPAFRAQLEETLQRLLETIAPHSNATRIHPGVLQRARSNCREPPGVGVRENSRAPPPDFVSNSSNSPSRHLQRSTARLAAANFHAVMQMDADQIVPRVGEADFWMASRVWIAWPGSGSGSDRDAGSETGASQKLCKKSVSRKTIERRGKTIQERQRQECSSRDVSAGRKAFSDEAQDDADLFRGGDTVPPAR